VIFEKTNKVTDSQDDGLVGVLRKNIPSKLALVGLRPELHLDDDPVP
jgi:hypothetical protein